MKYAVSADLHLRPDAPRCRLDKNWEKTMEDMLKFIVSYSKKHDADLILVGDILDTSQIPHWVVNMFLSLVNKAIIFAGNHDFKYRNMNEIESSAIGHILKNPKYKACVPEFENGFFELTGSIMLCHRLVYRPENADLAKFKNGISTDDLIEKALEINPEVKWIFIGDNHHKFHYEKDDVHVVNPGSPLIYNASMIGEKCGFYLVDTDENTVEAITVPDSEDLVTDQYLRDEEAHSESLQTFVSILEDTEVETLDFFEICDEKEKEMNSDFRDLYEEIKDETLKIHNKAKKGA